jgi:hypothetical protein
VNRKAPAVPESGAVMPRQAVTSRFRPCHALVGRRTTVVSMYQGKRPYPRHSLPRCVLFPSTHSAYTEYKRLASSCFPSYQRSTPQSSEAHFALALSLVRAVTARLTSAQVSDDQPSLTRSLTHHSSILRPALAHLDLTIWI